MGFSIIVPMLNEVQGLPRLLARLCALERQGNEVLVVDGGSDDGTQNEETIAEHSPITGELQGGNLPEITGLKVARKGPGHRHAGLRPPLQKWPVKR